MKTVTLEMPATENQSELVRLLRLDLAMALYRDGTLSPGRAAELAGMGRWEFGDAAKAHGVPVPYTDDMLREDFAHGGNR